MINHKMLFLVIWTFISAIILTYLVNDMIDTIQYCNDMNLDSLLFEDCLASRGWAPLGYEYKQ